MTDALAHSDGHLLATHLQCVATKAADFSAAFEPAAATRRWAWLAGLWHDLGKYRLGFQRYIGELVSGRGDAVNMHDMLTGSTADGRLDTSAPDTTCGGWTQSGAGSAIVGHHDRIGINESAPMKSWNASHATPGCSPEALKSVGGAGLFYCFAAN